MSKKKTVVGSHKIDCCLGPQKRIMPEKIIVIVFSDGSTDVVGCPHYDRGLVPCCNPGKTVNLSKDPDKAFELPKCLFKKSRLD